jgi:omega-amidase
MSTLTITTIQTDLAWEDKTANLQRLEEKIINISDRTEVVILPEMFSTGFSMRPEALAEKMDGPTVAWMKRIAAEKKIILTGSIIIEEEGKYFNRLIWMLPNGQYGNYDKRHLFAYAGEAEKYTAGQKRLIASVKGWKVNLQICYDVRFPVWSRQTPQMPVPGHAMPGSVTLADTHAQDSAAKAAPATSMPVPGAGMAHEYDLLIYIANWPERRSLAWKTLLQARAIENQAYVAGVNRVGNDGNNIYHSGDSMIIDPLGEVLYHRSREEDIFTHTFQKDKLEEARNRFPFWRDADDFSIQL